MFYNIRYVHRAHRLLGERTLAAPHWEKIPLSPHSSRVVRSIVCQIATLCHGRRHLIPTWGGAAFCTWVRRSRQSINSTAKPLTLICEATAPAARRALLPALKLQLSAVDPFPDDGRPSDLSVNVHWQSMMEALIGEITPQEVINGADPKRTSILFLIQKRIINQAITNSSLMDQTLITRRKTTGWRPA